MRRFLATFSATVALATAGHAADLRIAASIAPVQGLVAAVTDGVQFPDLLLPAGADSHSFTLRPSTVRTLSRADVVFMVGAGMEGWLASTIDSTPKAERGRFVELARIDGTETLAAREFEEFGAEDHEHDHDHADGSDIDPHLWLDPDNARLWLAAIADQLAALDPDNAAVYRANAKAAAAEIDVAVAEVMPTFDALTDIELIVAHDSLQYLEHAFGLNVAGAYSASDGHLAGARTFAEIDTHIAEGSCIVLETGHSAHVEAELPAGVPVVEIDPLGTAALDSGSYFPALLRDIATGLSGCLN